MSSLSFITHVAATDSGDHSRITDLEILTVDGTTHLFSTTRYDGIIQHWDLGGADLALGSSLTYANTDFAGSDPGLATLSFASGTYVLAGGASGNTLQTVAVIAGGIGTTTPLDDLPSYFGGFQHSTTLTLDGGEQMAVGAMAGGGGLASITFSATGALTGSDITYGGSTNQIAATAVAQVDGAQFVLATSSSTNDLTTYAVAGDGSMTEAGHIDGDTGLWISAATVLETVEVGGITYALLGAAGTDSITVVEIGDDGSMTVRDHILDSRDTRFGGITALEIVEVDGKTYVIAGGADDGLSVFLMLEGGLLIHRHQIADTVDASLDNISDIAVHGQGSGIDIYVASSREPGVTQVRVDAGLPGVTQTAALGGGLLTGTTGNDILQGHDGDDIIASGVGDDILRDGQGSDVMTGGAGEDVFILSADGALDTITDFTLGEDTLDLSLWPMLRDISQLQFSLRPDGMEITYGDEVLVVLSADGTTIDYRDLTPEDVIGLPRFPIIAVPGYPGPPTPVIAPGQPPVDPERDAGGPNSNLTTLEVIADKNADVIRDGLGGDVQDNAASGMLLSGDNRDNVLTGAAGFDVLFGGAGDDHLHGMGGNDSLFGNSGNDVMDGGRGADTLFGGDGNDIIFGGNGQDYVNGGDGDDVVFGGTGDDVLIGGDGADEFVFGGGMDVAQDFVQGVDEVTLDASVWTGLTSVTDVLFLYASYADGRMTIDLGDGDILYINGVMDPDTMVDSINLF